MSRQLVPRPPSLPRVLVPSQKGWILSILGGAVLSRPRGLSCGALVVLWLSSLWLGGRHMLSQRPGLGTVRGSTLFASEALVTFMKSKHNYSSPNMFHSLKAGWKFVVSSSGH